MKKLFTLMAAAFMAVGVNAQTTLFDFENGDTPSTTGTSEVTTVKIHTNSDAVSCIKLNNSHLSGGVIVENFFYIEGDFQEGDVVTIAGAINNSSETKVARVVMFTGEIGEEPTDLFTTDYLINGRLVGDEPVAETFTLTDNATKLCFGRANKASDSESLTAANVTTLKVVRPADPTAITSVAVEDATSDSPVYNLQGQKVSKDTKGILIQDGKKFVNK